MGIFKGRNKRQYSYYTKLNIFQSFMSTFSLNSCKYTDKQYLYLTVYLRDSYLEN